ncbi:hypothetical protein AA103196_2188 [Ameyamaea chiangmaiensis NBRC 103196]|nr:hypothetical protein AA103196_2188 [Ameyamaea chiangmaiensis NBRC 103196]
MRAMLYATKATVNAPSRNTLQIGHDVRLATACPFAARTSVGLTSASETDSVPIAPRRRLVVERFQVAVMRCVYVTYVELQTKKS